MSDFKNMLKALRNANGLTQDELSRRLKISRSTISMYESGLRQPDFETLELIADYFNVDIDYLLGRSVRTTLLPEAIHSESTILQLYERLDSTDQARIMERIETMLEADKYKVKDASGGKAG